MEKDEKIKQYIKVLLEEKENIKSNKDLVSEASSLASNESLSINNKGLEEEVANINTIIDKVLETIEDCIENYNKA